MAVPAYLWILGGGGAALALSAAAKPSPPKRARGVARARGPSSLARWAPEVQRLAPQPTAPQVAGSAMSTGPLSLSRHAPERRRLQPWSSETEARGYASELQKMLTYSELSGLLRQGIREATEAGETTGNWDKLAQTVKLGIEAIAAEGMNPNAAEANGPALVAYALADPRVNWNLSEPQLRAQIGRAAANIWAGPYKGAYSAGDAPAACSRGAEKGLKYQDNKLPFDRETQKPTINANKRDFCIERLNLVNNAWTVMQAKGGAKRAPLADLRRLLAKMALGRARMNRFGGIERKPHDLP